MFHSDFNQVFLCLFFFGFRWNLVTDHIAPQVKALAAKTDDPSSVTGTHVVQEEQLSKVVL